LPATSQERRQYKKRDIDLQPGNGSKENAVATWATVMDALSASTSAKNVQHTAQVFFNLAGHR
jgi:hypothetical protein